MVRFSSQICFFILENLRKRASVAVNWRKSVPRVKANELCSSKTQKKASSYQFGKFVLKGLRNGLYLKRNYFIYFRASWSSIFQNINITITATNIREKHKGFQVFDCKIREIKKFNFIIWEKKRLQNTEKKLQLCKLISSIAFHIFDQINFNQLFKVCLRCVKLPEWTSSVRKILLWNFIDS